MKEKIETEKIIEIFNKALIDDCQEFIKVLPDKILKHNSLRDSGFPEKLDQESQKNFTIFIFALELFCLPNIFNKHLAEKLRKLSISSFVIQINYDKDKLLREIKNYEEKLLEDIRVGINPFDSLGVLSILCEKLKCEKTVEVGKVKSFCPILTTLLGNYITTSLIGRWKKVNDKYELM